MRQTQNAFGTFQKSCVYYDNADDSNGADGIYLSRRKRFAHASANRPRALLHAYAVNKRFPRGIYTPHFVAGEREEKRILKN